MIIAGRVADKVSAKKLIPAGIMYQIVVFTLYCFVPNPLDPSAYVLAVFQVGTQMIMIVSMQSYIAKRCPKNIRGMIFAVIGICCALGTVGYLQIYGYLARMFNSQVWAFATIAIIDAIWLVIIVFFILIGKYGAPAPGTDDQEDQEQLEIRGPDAGDDIDDIKKI